MEQIQVLDHYPGSFADSVFRIDAAIRPDFQRQFVIIRNITYAGIGNTEFYPGNRRINAINRYPANPHIIPFILVTGNIAPALVNKNVHLQMRIFVEGRNVQIRIQDFNITVRINICSSNLLFSRYINVKDFNICIKGMQFHAQSLDIQNNVRYVLPYAGNRSKLMQHAFNLDANNCRTLQGRKQNPAQAVAQCNAVTAFQRFPDKLAVTLISGNFRSNQLRFNNFNHAESLLLSRITTIRQLVGGKRCSMLQ